MFDSLVGNSRSLAVSQSRFRPALIALAALMAMLSLGAVNAPRAQAGAALFKDVNPGADGSDPGRFATMGDTLFFAASDNENGSELWRSDGTTPGTRLVKGFAGDNPGYGSYISSLKSIGGTLYLTISRGYDTSLYSSDGTAAGTRYVNSNPSLESVGELTEVDGTLFFRGDDASPGPGRLGSELWKSEGPGRATLVKDINPGDGFNNESDPQSLTAVGGTLFFTAYGRSTNHPQLWKSDGTEAGTTMVAPGEALEDPSYLTNVDGTLFFIVSGPTDWELWKSNGTAAGTVFVDAMGPITEGVFVDDPFGLRDVDGTLFFVANGGELWRSNGTSANTFRLKGFPNNPNRLTDVNGTLFFNAFTEGSGRELWRSDGTDGGTIQVADINPGDGNSAPEQITAFAGDAFFTANDGSTGRELWRSDGTAAGTSLVRDIRPGTVRGRPARGGISDLTPFGSSLVFSANDGAHGEEVWRFSEAAPSRSAVRLDWNRIRVSGGGLRAQLICPERFDACHNVRVSLFSRSNSGGAGELVAYRFLRVVRGHISTITLRTTARGRRLLRRRGGVMWVKAYTRSRETRQFAQWRIIGELP